MKNIFFFIAFLFVPLFICGQTLDTLRGLIKDSTGNPIPGANVWLYTTTDTLHGISNEFGRILFPINYSGTLSVKATSLTYNEGRIDILMGRKYFELVLYEKMTILKEVVVKGTLSPIILKKDTVEYDVSHYIQSPNDVIQDLLARLPGLQVNQDGSISMQGQKITKIRVNGEEFMVDNINTLTSIIPANLINKIQLIDDYGEEGKLTGRTIGSSQKVLNLKTENNVKKFYAGRIFPAIGTLGLYSLSGYILGYSRQNAINISFKNSNMGWYSGKSNTTETELTFRRQINRRLSINTGMNWGWNYNNINSESEIRTVISDEILNDKIISAQEFKDRSFTHKTEVNYAPNDKNNFFLHFNGTLRKNKKFDNLTDYQTGFQVKDQFTINDNTAISNKYNGDLSFSHKFKKEGRVIFLLLDINNINDHGNLKSNNKLRYYNIVDSSYSDSTLNQFIITKDFNRLTKIKGTYVEPLNKNSSLQITYSYYVKNQKHTQTTNWIDENEKYTPIDSLSNSYNYITKTNQISLNYLYHKEKLEYILGAEINAYSLNGNVRLTGLSIFPILQLSYYKSNMKWFKINFLGEILVPSYQQITPVPDYSNIQSPIYGNPNLKAAQRYTISSNFSQRYSSASILFNISSTIISNNIVNNIYLVEDGLGTVKQEIHFLNANGSYSIQNTNEWRKEFRNNKGYISIKIGGNFSNNILYFQDLKWNSKSLGIKNGIGIRYEIWKFFDMPEINYSINRNIYSVYDQSWVTLHTINAKYGIESNISKNWGFNINGSKQINWGSNWSINKNPFLIDARFYKYLFNNKILITLDGSNLLDQATNVNQSLSGNIASITTTSNRGRYFLFSFIYRLTGVE